MFQTLRYPCLPEAPPMKKDSDSWLPYPVDALLPLPFFHENMSRADSSPLTAAFASNVMSLHSEGFKL